MAKLDRRSDENTAAVETALRATTRSRGFVSNLMRLLTLAPQAQQAHVAYGHHLRFDTSLTDRQRELIICATVRQVPYAWAHHRGLLAQLAPDLDLDTLRAGRIPPGLANSEQRLVRFVFAYVTGEGVEQQTLDALLESLTPAQVIEASLLSSYYLGGAALIAAFDLDIDSPDVLRQELSWQRDRLAAIGTSPSIGTPSQ